MIREHPGEAWAAPLSLRPAQTPAQQELTTLLLAVNYELLGYPPAEAWMFADREMSTASGSLDG